MHCFFIVDLKLNFTRTNIAEIDYFIACSDKILRLLIAARLFNLHDPNISKIAYEAADYFFLYIA